MTKLLESMRSVVLDLPGDTALLESAGKVSLVHSQLELVLRMTIKTLSGLSLQDALDATEKTKSWELRGDIAKLFRQKTKDVTLQYKLKALLGKCERLSERRNRLLHNAWAIAQDGTVVVKGERHAWGNAPTPNDLNELAAEIHECVRLLNDARLTGFIADVCKPAK